MRRTHAEFIRFIFSDEVVEAGMDHGVYGPADQGAYNRFFAGYFDVHLEASWNWKPYWGTPPMCHSCISTAPSRTSTLRTSAGATIAITRAASTTTSLRFSTAAMRWTGRTQR